MFPIPSALWMKIGAALALCAVMYFLGWNHEHKKLVAYQAEVAAVGKAQEVINQAKAKEHENLSESIKSEYDARLSAVHNYYADRVQPDTSSRNVSPVSPAACRVDARPTNVVPAEQCAETTLKYVMLKKWIKGVTDVK